MRAGVAAFALFLAFGAAPAHSVPVDLELVIAIDVSGSVDAGELALQRDGWVAALTDPGVVAAIQAGPIGRIAVSVVYWSGSTVEFDNTSVPGGAVETEQLLKVAVPWMVIEDATTASSVGAALLAATAQFVFEYTYGSTIVTRTVGTGDAGVGQTGVARAIDFSAAQLLSDNGFEGTRRVIDLMGDGYENIDHDPNGCSDPTACPVGAVYSDPAQVITDPETYFAATAAARDAAVAAGITVNGLAILTDVGTLDTFFYALFATGGPGSFVQVANGFSDIQAAATEKLTTEVVPEPAAMPLLAGALALLAIARRRRG